MIPLKIAVIGSGISGLSAAWLLAKKHHVTLIEASDRLGGHTNTVEMDIDGRLVPVDTGFICFNSITYPNLMAFLRYLDVPIHDTSMSFSASLAHGAYEYSGGTYSGLLAQPSNLFRSGHWRMIRDIIRFFKEAPQSLESLDEAESLNTYLARNGYSDEFTRYHLLPMAAAIWSSHLRDMLGYPAKSFIRFFQNHGLLQVSGRPAWATVRGGASSYIDKILGDSRINVVAGAPVQKIRRMPHCVEIKTHRGAQSFDHVVVASHANQALEMLADPDHQEQRLLGSFQYSQNLAVLHCDRRFMPRRKLAWASWNYMDFRERLNDVHQQDMCLTYWMNSLQKLNTTQNVFVTLNPPENMEIREVAKSMHYTHPIFDHHAMRAQRELWALQGTNRTWYCGAHFGAGFHEDGLQSGLAVAEQLGGVRRPWSVENESGRIFIQHAPMLWEAAE